jgi:hypothetical protein
MGADPGGALVAFQRMRIVPVRKQIKPNGSTKKQHVKYPMIHRDFKNAVTFNGKRHGCNTVKTI